MEEQIINTENDTDNLNDRAFPLIRIIYRNLTLIIALTVICLTIGILYSTVIKKPVYTAKCDTIFKLVFEDGSTSNIKEASLAKTSMPTLSDFIKSSAVEKTAREESGDNGISRGAVGVNYSKDSLIITVSYTAATSSDAEKKLRAYINAVNEESNKKTPIENVRIISFEELQNEYVVTESKGGARYIIISLIAGLALGVSIALIRYLLDNKLKDKDELEEITGASLLSYIDKQ